MAASGAAVASASASARASQPTSGMTTTSCAAPATPIRSMRRRRAASAAETSSRRYALGSDTDRQRQRPLEVRRARDLLDDALAQRSGVEDLVRRRRGAMGVQHQRQLADVDDVAEASARVPSMRSPLTVVPLWLSRSTMRALPSAVMTLAWLRDAV